MALSSDANVEQTVHPRQRSTTGIGVVSAVIPGSTNNDSRNEIELGRSGEEDVIQGSSTVTSAEVSGIGEISQGPSSRCDSIVRSSGVRRGAQRRGGSITLRENVQRSCSLEHNGVPERGTDAQNCDVSRSFRTPIDDSTGNYGYPGTIDQANDDVFEPPTIVRREGPPVGRALYHELSTTWIPSTRNADVYGTPGTNANPTRKNNSTDLPPTLQSGSDNSTTGRDVIPRSSIPVRDDSSPCNIRRTMNQSRYTNDLSSIATSISKDSEHFKYNYTDDPALSAKQLEGLYRDRRGGRSHGASNAPQPPVYFGLTYNEKFKADAITAKEYVPLKTTPKISIDQEMLKSWGWKEQCFIDDSVFQMLDYSKLADAEYHECHHLSKYRKPLEETGRFVAISQHDSSEFVYNYGKPVLKSDGRSARWVVDPVINKCFLSTVDYSVKLPRIEHILAMSMLYDGCTEIDADSYYDQFDFSNNVRALFAHKRGRSRIQPVGMVQGYAPATRVAHQALNAIRTRAFIGTAVAHTSYIDNLYVFGPGNEAACSSFMEVSTRVNARFRIEKNYSTTFIVLGTQVERKGHDLLVGPKPSWAQRYVAYLRPLSSSSITHVTVSTMMRIIGTSVWAMRSMGLPLAAYGEVIEAYPDPSLDEKESVPLSDGLRRTIRDLSELVSAPRSTLPCSLRHVCFAYSDATPFRVASVIWPRSCIPRTATPTTIEDDPIAQIINCCGPADRMHARVYAINTPRIHANLTELMAIVLTVINTPPCTLLAIASDSRVAKSWARKGWSKNSHARSLIRLLYEVARDRHIRIAIAYVPGVLNLSDPFTRHDLRTGDVIWPWFRPMARFEMATWW